MSYWVGCTVDIGGDEPYWHDSQNYTSNVSPMWREALGRSLGDFDDAPCSEAGGVLRDGIAAMEADPAKYRAMSPKNGWGDYEGALDYLRFIEKLCRIYPTGHLTVHH